MNKGICAFALLIATSAMAHGGGRHGGHSPHWHRHHHHPHSNWHWAIPAVVTGAIVYRALEPNPPVYIQPHVHQPVPSNCTPWTEFQNPDGSITRSRTCY